MALALDEQKDNDNIYDVKGFQFLVDKNLMETVAPIELDMTEGGFIIRSSLQMAAGGCSSSCSTC